MNRFNKELVNSLFAAGGTMNITEIDIKNKVINADAKIQRYEYIKNYLEFIHGLKTNSRTVDGCLYCVMVAYRQFYKTNRKLLNILKKIKPLPFKEQNKAFIKAVLPVIVRYCKYLHELRKDSDFYKRNDLANI